MTTEATLPVPSAAQRELFKTYSLLKRKGSSIVFYVISPQAAHRRIAVAATDPIVGSDLDPRHTTVIHWRGSVDALALTLGYSVSHAQQPPLSERLIANLIAAIDSAADEGWFLASRDPDDEPNTVDESRGRVQVQGRGHRRDYVPPAILELADSPPVVKALGYPLPTACAVTGLFAHATTVDGTPTPSLALAVIVTLVRLSDGRKFVLPVARDVFKPEQLKSMVDPFTSALSLRDLGCTMVRASNFPWLTEACTLECAHSFSPVPTLDAWTELTSPPASAGSGEGAG